MFLFEYPSASEMRLTQVVIEKGIVLQPGILDFERREIQDLLQDTKRFLLRQDAAFDRVSNLHEKALGLRRQHCLRSFQLAVEQEDLLARREKGQQIGNNLASSGEEIPRLAAIEVS